MLSIVGEALTRASKLQLSSKVEMSRAFSNIISAIRSSITSSVCPRSHGPEPATYDRRVSQQQQYILGLSDIKDPRTTFR
jgi:hypothetical protein